MVKYILKRFLHALLSLFIIVTLIFCLLRLMPIEGYLGASVDKMSEEVKAAKLAAKGLDKPLHVQLFTFYRNLLRGNLGKSWIYRENVEITKIIKPKIAVSIKLGVIAMALSLCLGIPLGILMTRHKGKSIDKLGNAFIVFIESAPSAVYFLFIQMYLTKGTGIPILYDRDNKISWILPIFSLALPSIAGYAMWLRRYMVDRMNQDYVKLAMAKGVSYKQIMSKHVFRNAIVPMVQTLPSSILYTLTGSLYIESIYSIPGMGGLLIEVIQRQDNTMVQALVLIYAAIGILGLFLGDLLMGIVDPRIRLTGKEESR